MKRPPAAGRDRPHGPSEPVAVVPGSQGRPDNCAWVIGLASGGWLKLILLRAQRGVAKSGLLGR